jgi:hypothetical protein
VYFIPFIVETGGRVNKAAHDWLDTETVLREAMKALVRVQAHMLSRSCGGDPLYRYRPRW